MDIAMLNNVLMAGGRNNMGKWANKIVTKRDDPTEHHWACSICGKEYEKQSDAWECCGDKKKLPWREKHE